MTTPNTTNTKETLELDDRGMYFLKRGPFLTVEEAEANRLPEITNNTVGSVEDLANIYGWHTDKCMGNIHSADCPVLKLKQIIQTLQQQAKAEERDKCANIVADEISNLIASDSETDAKVKKYILKALNQDTNQKDT